MHTVVLCTFLRRPCLLPVRFCKAYFAFHGSAHSHTYAWITCHLCCRGQSLDSMHEHTFTSPEHGTYLDTPSSRTFNCSTTSPPAPTDSARSVHQKAPPQHHNQGVSAAPVPARPLPAAAMRARSSSIGGSIRGKELLERMDAWSSRRGRGGCASSSPFPPASDSGQACGAALCNGRGSTVESEGAGMGRDGWNAPSPAPLDAMCGQVCATFCGCAS